MYRTREALNNNASFLSNANEYPFYPNCIMGDMFSFWHYPGTYNEISTTFLAVKDKIFKYPSLLSFHPVRQQLDGQSRLVTYNLAFAALSDSNWTTEQRDAKVFETILRPIYTEFIRQIEKSKYFRNLPFGYLPHDYYEVFSSGDNQGVLIEKYGDHIDAIEIHNLRLDIKKLCDGDIQRIERENELVTKQIIKS